MLRPFLILAATTFAASSALAQSGATHVDATGAVAGRSPHKILRPVAASARCDRALHLPAGKLPTYGTPAPDSRCQPLVIASDQRTKVAVE